MVFLHHIEQIRLYTVPCFVFRHRKCPQCGQDLLVISGASLSSCDTEAQDMTKSFICISASRVRITVLFVQVLLHKWHIYHP